MLDIVQKKEVVKVEGITKNMQISFVEENENEVLIADSDLPSFVRESPALTTDMKNQKHLDYILTCFCRAGFDLNVVTPWVDSFSDEVLLEESDETMMCRWIEYLKSDTDVDMMVGTEGRETDVLQLKKWGLTLEAARYLRDQFTLESWCEYDLYSQMFWWVLEGRNEIGVISTTTYPLDTPSDYKVDVWVDIGHYGVPTYYVSKEVMESSNISDKIVNEFCEFVNQPDNDLILFHATKWEYMRNVLKGIAIPYIPRRSDFNPRQAFYTTSEFNTAIRHCYIHNKDWKGCSCIIIFLLPSEKVKQENHYINLEGDDWKEVVANCRNGGFSESLRKKWFVQGYQLSNHTEVIRSYNYVGKEQAKRLADSHHPPRDQIAAVHDCGGEILDSAIKGVIIFPKQKY
ncbi:hypothetical protein RclHR1_14750003 [Rhizophagus clarus]|uniref:Uncharacterized protein n=1 Tax=Rhizophagus clarus TaxID=94130 RepID=A0A2Z6R5Z3_9GLOM|nr:hypothetical protein RclHR1_14750003 [Rhizophagus clarus]GET03603.1 hypothetical protein GLOIN_2v1763590 [Rhizophagus clarus]